MGLTAATFAAGFLLAFLGAAAPTGPIAMLVLERSLRRHYAAALALGVGSALPESVYAGLAAFGLDAVFARFPAAEVVARGATLVVLGVLGFRMVRFRHEPEQQGDPGGRPAPTARRRAFALGFGVSAANPLLLLTWGTSVAMLYSLLGLRLDEAGRWVFPLAVAAGIVTAVATTVTLVRRYDRHFTVRLATLAIRSAGALLLALGVVAGAALAIQELGA